MLEQLFLELQNYPERMLLSSKEQFRDYLIAKATQLKLPVEVFPQSKMARNVVVGNLQQAKVIIGAHYDTAPRMFSWMMNHMVLFKSG
jgi:acetylornithine deacetylase/succinyl-diaminopimelate desuccinylase-like protein